MRKGESADKSWQDWERVEVEKWSWKVACERNLDDCSWWEKGYWACKLTEATLGLEKAHADKALNAEFRHAAHAIMNTEAFKTVENEINNAYSEISRFERALEKLVDQGPMAYIEELSKDEKRDLEREIELLDDLMAASKQLEEELRAAKDALDETSGRLSPEQEAARGRIADLEAEIERKPFEHDYRNKQQDFDRIKTQADALLRTLEDVKGGIRVGADVVRQVTNLFRKGIPEIKEIKVSASSAALANHEPLTFKITVGWMGDYHVCQVEWVPSQDAHVLYSDAARKVVELGDH